MNDKHESPIIYVISDSIGETAEFVVRAAASQFNGGDADVRRVPYVDSKEAIDDILDAAFEEGALIAFTLVVPELQAYLTDRASEKGISHVDIMGPMLNALEGLYKRTPKMEPGLVRKLDEDYFRKVEAIEFAVKYDDGRDPRGLLRADVVLIGVSRTSKTPLSMYLAHKRIKVANVPLVPEVPPPDELFRIPGNKIIGLTIDADHLNRIREERLKALGLTAKANYANMARIESELAYSRDVMQRLGCHVINVSTKAVEETANVILDMIRQGLTKE
ncbi:pyruvate, water dikinase regulatory protein [Numidum massiliense]|uniref:pyruvate, water dikinase regulatory protein n=1 Tax=Numidum massiliense TaxID=1522315 RepID=UPI0006D59235|nr:pyruvate, water dikinase regulatory protein [Numidum massiliense]